MACGRVNGMWKIEWHVEEIERRVEERMVCGRDRMACCGRIQCIKLCFYDTQMDQNTVGANKLDTPNTRDTRSKYLWQPIFHGKTAIP
ncbi:hypothetical protein FKM82_026726 [Ascaphus truei]